MGKNSRIAAAAVAATMALGVGIGSVAHAENPSQWPGQLMLTGTDYDEQLGNGAVLGSQSSFADSNGRVRAAKDVAVAYNHVLAVTSFGEVYSWGDNYAGQLGLGDTTSRWSPTRVAGLPPITQISGGANHALARTADGRVFGWGGGFGGSLLEANLDRYVKSPVDLGLSDVASIAAGYERSAFVKVDGTLWMAGSSDNGQTCTGSRADVLTPTLVPLGGPVAQVSTWESGHTLIVMANGTMRACGLSANGRLGFTTPFGGAGATPRWIPGVSGVREVAATAMGALARRYDGTVLAWGRQPSGELGLPEAAQDYPVTVVPGVRANKVASGGTTSAIIARP